MATEPQLDKILRLANELTGQRVGYISQSAVLSEPRRGWSNTEASLLLDDLQEAIEAENRRRETTGVIEGKKITFSYTLKNGDDGGILTGTVRGYKWSGTQVIGVYLRDIDASQATYEPNEANWYELIRMHDISVGEGTEALKAERQRLLARVAEIDTLLAGKED